MNTRNRQLGDMLPCELIQYGREAHSVVAWETVALELERRLVTRRRPDVNDGLDVNDWDAAHREDSRDYIRVDDVRPLGLLGETWRLPTKDSEDMATGIR